MKPIIISEGDPCGIGYEILNKSKSNLEKLSKKNLVLLVKSQNTINCEIFQNLDPVDLKENLPVKGLYQFSFDLKESIPKNILKLGKPSKVSGRIAFHSFKFAMNIQKKIGGNLITLPLSKEWVIQSGEKNFRGHTEELSKSYNTQTTMMMIGPTMKVILLTTHVPLSKVVFELKRLKIQPMIDSIKNCEILKNPRIAICGINPHSGENGKIGNEEKTILPKIISQFRKNGIRLVGPISADSIFQDEIRKNFDIILACYHDQGLIPFKSIEGKKGVNLTLGLNFLRVSPDHGTAFDIAGKGLADPTSFLECLKIVAN